MSAPPGPPPGPNPPPPGQGPPWPGPPQTGPPPAPGPYAPGPGQGPGQYPPQPGQGPPTFGPPPQKQDNGCLKWGLIGGAVILVFGVLGVGCLVFAGNRLADEIDDRTGTADAGDYDITVDSCQATETGSLTATGTLTNTSDKAQGFEVEIRFSDAEGTLLDASSTFVDRLDKGQRGNWTTTSFSATASSTDIECEIDSVSYSLID